MQIKVTNLTEADAHTPDINGERGISLTKGDNFAWDCPTNGSGGSSHTHYDRNMFGDMLDHLARAEETDGPDEFIIKGGEAYYLLTVEY